MCEYVVVGNGEEYYWPRQLCEPRSHDLSLGKSNIFSTRVTHNTVIKTINYQLSSKAL